MLRVEEGGEEDGGRGEEGQTFQNRSSRYELTTAQQFRWITYLEASTTPRAQQNCILGYTCLSQF